MSEANLLMGLLGGISLGMTGALIWGVTRMAADGGLQRNQAAGIRTAATKASPEAWRAGHRAALPWARRLGIFGLVGGAVLVACGFLEVADPEALHPLTVGAFVVGYGGVLLGSIALVQAASKGAKRASLQPDRSWAR
ncbi:SdpI family protein [Ornithinimicrobium pratense]|uniref:SdpI family protein n=1 Tax=Ornithinimicrobium pratense TaxID=2593973 RepID=A0A5J6V2P2_9MICO|nr:SdpI family protein [Ornithinimicrobium pratense]QFG67995.1 SdpI family protein [Ornithinimicrobium pratense]